MFGWGSIIAEEAARQEQQSAAADRLLRELDEQIVRSELQRAAESVEYPGVPRLGEDWTYSILDARDGELAGAPQRALEPSIHTRPRPDRA